MQSRINNPLEACTERLLPDVMQYGGKFGPLEHLRRIPKFSRHILPTEFVMPGESVTRDSAFEEPLVRASHHIDIRDMVGVLETQRAESRSAEHVDAMVTQIRRQAATRDVIGFANYSAGPDAFYNPDDVVLGVQPFVHGLRASVVRHPNRPSGDDEFVISWFRQSESDEDPLASGLEIRSATYDVAGNTRHSLGNTLYREQENMSPRALIDLYRMVEEEGVMRPDRVFMMEAVGDQNDLSVPPYICQLRDFLGRETADWRINQDQIRYDLPKLVFGVTPQEGVALRVLHSPDGCTADGKPLTSPDVPWAFLKTQHKNEPPLHFQPQGMYAYLAGFGFGSGMASLAHRQERLAAAADVTVFDHKYYDGVKQPADFSRRMIAEMLPEGVLTDFQKRQGVYDSVRAMADMAERNTDLQYYMLEFLEATHGKTMDILLKSDGYTATISKL